MANDMTKVSLPTPTEPVGAKRGGPGHLVDGIGSGKGLITPREIGRGVTPQPANNTTDKGLGGKLV